jgi:histidyl-tRNA synthetase
MSNNLLATNPYKGTRDFYPGEMAVRNWFFSRMKEVVARYGYEEYNGPILESFDLYAAKSGQELVNEQIYHFMDRGDRKLAIRPEMTPTVARMVAARLGELTFPLRWFSIANLMRYERPQKGRLREHWQLNVDIFGESDIRADAEIVSIIADLMLSFGAEESMFKIKINNRKFFNDVLTSVLDVRGEDVQAISKAVDKRAKVPEEAYRKWLLESGITDENINRLDTIFGSSLEQISQMLGDGSEGARELTDLFTLLKEAGLDRYVEFDFSIVRGLDYYTGTVFEVYDTSPGNRRALFGGGRYDNLIGLFKNAEISGVGFGFGDVTFQNFLETHGLVPGHLDKSAGVMIALFDETPYAEYLKLAAELRENDIPATIYMGRGSKLKKQLSFAGKKMFPLVILAGPDEIAGNKVMIKQMAAREQLTVDRSKFIDKIKQLLAQTSSES